MISTLKTLCNRARQGNPSHSLYQHSRRRKVHCFMFSENVNVSLFGIYFIRVEKHCCEYALWTQRSPFLLCYFQSLEYWLLCAQNTKQWHQYVQNQIEENTLRLYYNAYLISSSVYLYFLLFLISMFWKAPRVSSVTSFRRFRYLFGVSCSVCSMARNVIGNNMPIHVLPCHLLWGLFS